jgi:hypothetical protein
MDRPNNADLKPRRANSDVDPRIEILAETALEAEDLADAELPKEIGAGAEVVI